MYLEYQKLAGNIGECFKMYFFVIEAVAKQILLEDECQGSVFDLERFDGRRNYIS